MAENIVELRAVSKHYGGLMAVDCVSLTVQEGEVLGLIGPNGAGKTTVIDLLSGVQQASSGQMLWRGQDITRLKPHERVRLGLTRTFQVTRPFFGMTVRENVLTAVLFGRGTSTPGLGEAQSRADEVIESVGLLNYSARPANELTTAGAKRLELARCIATRPALICLDEVMAGLNSTEMNEAIALLRRINQEGTTIIFTEHILRAVMAVSHRIVVLANGRKIAEGLPAEVSADEAVRNAYIGHKRVWSPN